MSEASLIRRPSRLGDELQITSLAEGERAHLIAKGWDGVGFWRWVPTRSGRRCKVFYTVTRTGIAQRVVGYDLPERFRPLAPLKRGAPVPRAAAEPEPQDMAGALAEFEQRLLLAIRVDEAERDPDRRLLRVKTTKYETSAAPGDYPTGISTRFQPTLEQRDDAEIVLKWIARLDAKPATALRLKALGFSTKSIAERMHTNAAKARFLIKRAVTACWQFSRQAEPALGARAGRDHRRGKAAGAVHQS